MNKIVPATITIAIILSVAIMLGLYTENRTPEPQPTQIESSVSAISAYSKNDAVVLYTMKHDGHTFVVAHKGGVIHHPSCNCLK